MPSMNEHEKVATIIADAGGRVVGRTRLQKICYLLSVAELEEGFSFSYKHYGPYSEDLVAAARKSILLGLTKEAELPTSWGGTYSIYTSSAPTSGDEIRAKFVMTAAGADAVELELAATAVFLANEGFSDPWSETARRKPEKAEAGRIERAKSLLLKLSSIVPRDQLSRIC